MSDSKIRSVLFPEKIEKEDAAALRLAMSQMINLGTRKIICDFSHVQFISEDGAKELAAIGTLMNNLQGELGACFISQQAVSMLKETSIRKYFKIYDVKESILIVVLAELADTFAEYEDILDVKARLEGAESFIEIYLEFNEQKTIRQVQNTIDLLQQKLTEKIRNSHIVIIPRASS